jgi:hypothetical protein
LVCVIFALKIWWGAVLQIPFQERIVNDAMLLSGGGLCWYFVWWMGWLRCGGEEEEERVCDFGGFFFVYNQQWRFWGLRYVDVRCGAGADMAMADLSGSYPHFIQPPKAATTQSIHRKAHRRCEICARRLSMM